MRHWWIACCCLLVLGVAAALAAEEAEKKDVGPSLEYRPPRPVLPEPKGPTPAPPMTVFRESFGRFGIGRGSFDRPRDVAFGIDDRVYVLDAGNNRVQLFDKSNNFILEWGSSGTDASRCEFKGPTAIHVVRDLSAGSSDAPDIVHVVDTGNNRIQRFAIKADTKGLRNLPCGSAGSDVQILRPWGRNATTGGIGDGEFNRPLDLAFGIVQGDREPSMWVLDAGNERVQRFGYPMNDGYPPNEVDQETRFYADQLSQISGTRGNLKGLVSLAWSNDVNGYLYLLGTGCSLQRFRLNGVLEATWPAVAPESGLCVPARVRYDVKKEYLYVLDSGNGLLSIFHWTGNFIGALRGADRSFNRPGGFDFRPLSGKFVLADTGNNLVQKFTQR